MELQQGAHGRVERPAYRERIAVCHHIPVLLGLALPVAELFT
jgi:hypothetical protein